MVYNTCIIFGVFDGVHDGHLSFINEAKTKAKKLIAIVARDETVFRLKNKKPAHNETERLNAVADLKYIDKAYLGDKKEGDYKILKKISPDIIFLGYDQINLFNDLNMRIKNKEISNIKILFGTPYKPDKLHSSVLNKVSFLLL